MEKAYLLKIFADPIIYSVTEESAESQITLNKLAFRAQLIQQQRYWEQIPYTNQP